MTKDEMLSLKDGQVVQSDNWGMVTRRKHWLDDDKSVAFEVTVKGVTDYVWLYAFEVTVGE